MTQNIYAKGTSADDTLVGGAGRDTLDGGAGNDLLHGGRNTDLLIGGQGLDYMVGGGGADTFAFGPGDTGIGLGRRDVIADFAAHDKMDLRGFAQAGHTVSTKVLLEDDHDVVQVLLDGQVTAEIQASGHYHWSEDDFILA
ncbi:MAG TPA: hypothetical protein VE684_05975 [Crenalkalicoccus sp.]|nr:hypothetical protein [Crenalkalicoccus sp.]